LSPQEEVGEYICCGIPEDQLSAFHHSPWASAVLELVTRHTSVLRLESLATMPGLGAPPPGVPPLGAFLAIPLIQPGRLRGAVYMIRPEGAPGFSEEDEEILRGFAVGLEQGNLAEETRLLAQLQLLSRLGQATVGNLELQPILQVALRELDRHLPLYTTAVWLIQDRGTAKSEQRTELGSARTPGEAKDLHAAGSPRNPVPASLVLAEVIGPGLVSGMSLALAQTPFDPCFRIGEAVYADWTRAEERDNDLAERLFQQGATTCFAVPLRAGDQILGVLQSVCNRVSGFTANQIQLLYLVADLLGAAVSNCQLFGRLHAAYEELRITQGQLVEAEKMRALGELASGLAHEFNNALSGVLGFLDLALDIPWFDPRPRGYVESARACAVNAAEVVRQVQDFPGSRRRGRETAWVDLNDLVREGVGLVRHKWETLAQARGFRIAVDVRTEAAAGVTASPGELREVLTNLVFNAVDAMPQGGTLSLRTWSTASQVFLAVSDTGVGIPDDVLPRLFVPFFTTKGERGSGLGLSVTQRIVRRHGGEIHVESQPGRGSTFTVVLPAVPIPDRRPVTAVPAPAQAQAPGLRVLVVDDEDSVRRFLEVALTRMGHRVRVATNAREGVAAVAEERFDLVLTDLGLPDASGEEVVRGVGRSAPGTPVVMLTGWADQMAPEPPPGVMKVLGKPVTLDTLQRTVATVSGAVVK
jgi:signal transduction histidine kinase